MVKEFKVNMNDTDTQITLYKWEIRKCRKIETEAYFYALLTKNGHY
jgi:hypothetical protein